MSTFTYDPSGTPTLGGTNNLWVFLYHGMEQEGADEFPHYYYTGNGQFYNTQMVRSLSEVGETGTSGPGACSSGSAIGAPSGSSGSVPLFSGGAVLPSTEGSGKTAQTTITVSGSAAAGATIGALIGAAVGAPGAGALLGAVGGAIVGGIASFFFDLFGGGSPAIPRQLLHNRHPLYAGMLGVSEDLIVDEASAGAPEIVGDPHPANKAPLQTDGNVLEIPPQPTATATPKLTLQQLWQIARCSGLTDEALMELYQSNGVSYGDAAWLTQHRFTDSGPYSDPSLYHGCQPKPK